MKTDWKLLLLQIICVFVVGLIIDIIYGTPYYGYGAFYGWLDERFIITSFIIFLLCILMCYLFYREAKSHGKKVYGETIIFALSLIPILIQFSRSLPLYISIMRIQISWIITLLIPQVVYLVIKKYSWEK